MKKYNIAVVGASGVVGQKFLQILQERNLPVENYYLFASAKSAGKQVQFMGKTHVIEELCQENITNKKIDIALFSAGAKVSEQFAPIFAQHGTIVIDNSKQWRMDKNVPLVVPECNAEDIKNHNGIIANPNCSTIQAVVPLKVLDDKYKIKRIIYTTFQAVSGAGIQGINDLIDGAQGVPPKKIPKPIYGNIVPQIDDFLENGYTKEEEKMINETKKILHNENLKITATTVRVPVLYGHSESINIEFKTQPQLEEVKQLLRNTEGIVVMDDIKNGVYPTALDSVDKDPVYVGRIRLDTSNENAINIWVVADNIRKGAATNAIQIAEYIINKEL